jgi:hypothetical protein
VAAAGVALVAFLVVSSLRGLSAPDFPFLADEPDQSLHGTVAFVATTTNAGQPDAQWCLYLASASGEHRRTVACREQLKSDAAWPPIVAWLPDGRIELTHYAEWVDYGQGDELAPKWRLLVDPGTGAAEAVPPEEVPDTAPPPPTAAMLGEATVRAVNEDGVAKLEITDTSGTRTLWSSEGGSSLWAIGTPTWSPDGKWLLVPDEANRILLVTVDEPVLARVFLDEPASFAITPDDLLT